MHTSCVGFTYSYHWFDCLAIAYTPASLTPQEELTRHLTDANTKDKALTTKLATVTAAAIATEESLTGRIRAALEAQGEAEHRMRTLAERTAKEMMDVRRKHEAEVKKVFGYG